MPFPAMKSGSGTVLRQYSLGRYSCMLIQEPESIGPIKYSFMLLVTEQDSNALAMVVTCETNDMQNELLNKTAEGFDQNARTELLKNAPAAFFCIFDQQGTHRIVEQLGQVPDVENFLGKALALAGKQLGVSDEPVLLGTPPKTPQVTTTKHSKPFLLIGGAITIVVGAIMLYAFQQPKDVDECILKNMVGVTSNVAANSIRGACKNKFPAQQLDVEKTNSKPFGDRTFIDMSASFPQPTSTPQNRPLSLEEIQNIKGSAKLNHGNRYYRGTNGIVTQHVNHYYSGTLHNGNANLIVTQIEIAVTTTLDKKPTTQAYVIPVNARPNATSDFSFKVLTGDTSAKYQWEILSAQGQEIGKEG